jgi:DNA topoisomerase-3
MAALKTAAQDAPLTAAGYARQWTDWLLGINFTVAATKKLSADGKMLNVGRVILPTIYLIYLRDMEIKNFIPKKYFTLTATFSAAEGIYSGLYIQPAAAGESAEASKTRFDSPSNLEKIAAEVKGQPGVIVACATTRESQGPGKLFNLTDLQGHITSRYADWTAEKVLKCAQSLYEDKYITYPRTSSRYLDDTQKEAAKRSLEALKTAGQGLIPPSIPLIWHERKSVFDSAKVDSHPALMPTYLVPNIAGLSPDDRTIYTEIARRFLAQFAPAAEYDKTEAITRIKTHDFQTKVRVLVNPGWRFLSQDPVADIDQGEDKKDEDEGSATLDFALRENLAVVAKDLKATNKETKPPVKYTVKTLLAAMQNCGRKVEDETQLLKGYSIGTSATRAEILKKIEKSGYVEIKGKNYSTTALGIGLVEHFPVREMLEPDFTGRLEKQLKDVELGNMPQAAYMVIAREITALGIEKFKHTSGTIRREVKSIGKCPACGRDIVETPKAFSCVGYQDKTNQCKFALWKDDHWFASLGKKLTATTAKGLLSGRGAMVKGLTSKAGKKFDAKVIMSKDGERWKFSFENRN